MGRFVLNDEISGRRQWFCDLRSELTRLTFQTNGRFLVAEIDAKYFRRAKNFQFAETMNFRVDSGEECVWDGNVQRAK